MTDRIELAWTGTHRRRRLVFEPQDCGGWMRIEQELRESQWRTVGKEIVAGVELESPAAIVSDRLTETYSGP